MKISKAIFVFVSLTQGVLVMKLKIYSAVISFLILSFCSNAFPAVFPQLFDSTGRVGNSFIISVNNFSLPIRNDGGISNFDYGQLNGDMILFSGGFYIAGKAGNEIWASIVAPSTLEENYLPGAINDSLNLSKDIFVVLKSDPPFSKSWQDWKNAVKFGAKFYDGDSDGVYNPIDKNSDSAWNFNEDMPYLLGDVTTWCVYNDGGPHYLGWNVYPVGIEIQQTAFASNEIFMQNSVFIIYSIINRGLISDSLYNVYFSIWADPDIGEYSDDLVGCDSILSSGFT